MASRKRNYRNKQSPNRYDDGFNQQTYYNSQRSNQSGRENLYYCDICGYTFPQAGNIPPVCTRCLIPMTLLRTNSQARAKLEKKQTFDYSSKFYFKTEGHPQYKGLPLDHPDPDDVEAMEAYRLRKQGRRRRSGKPSGLENGSQEKHVKSYDRRNKPSHSSSEHKQIQEIDDVKTPDAPAEIETEKQLPATELPPKHKSISTSKQPRKPTRQKEKIKLEEHAEKELREEDYTGTALTNTRSAATILSDTLNKSQLNDISGDLRSDYVFNQPIKSPDTDQAEPVEKPEQDKSL